MEDRRHHLQAWVDRLRRNYPRALKELDDILARDRDCLPELLSLLDQRASSRVLRKLFRDRPDLLPADPALFDHLRTHHPRLLAFWLERHSLTRPQALQILRDPRWSKWPRRLQRQILRSIPNDLATLFRRLPDDARARLGPWLPVLSRTDLPAHFVETLRSWLQGHPVPDADALATLRRLQDATWKDRAWTLPALIQRSVDPRSTVEIPRHEVVWLLHQTHLTLPDAWVQDLVTALQRWNDPLLWTLARAHPQLAPHVPAPLDWPDRWYTLRDLLRLFGRDARRADEQRLAALLMELGAGIRRTRRHYTVHARELAQILDALPYDRFQDRLRHFYHRSDLDVDEATLKRLVRKRVLRVTALPRVFESLVEPRKLPRILRTWAREASRRQERRRQELRRLIELNLRPVEPRPFHPDPFQVQAVEAFHQGKDVLVTAPTGSGKTWIAEQAMKTVLANQGRAFYSTPLRALSYQKLRSFREKFGHENVGVLTGEYRENTTAPLLVGTTEIVRNLLLDGVHFDLLVMDEAHYLGDVERGSAWEEAILLTPVDTRMILLSATIPNAEEIQSWLQGLGRPVVIASRKSRPVPLEFLTWMEKGPELGLHFHGRHPSLDELLHTLKRLSMTPALVFVGRRDDATVLANKAAQILPRKSLPDMDLPRHPLNRLLFRGVAAHHAGLSYGFRAAVEDLLERGRLDFIFCTSSLAHGIDAPVRTTVLYDVSPFWDRSHLQHALGRAGRRGYDRVGFAVVALPPWNIKRIIRDLKKGAAPLESAFAPHDASVAGLIHRYGIDGAVELAQRSLRTYQGDSQVGQRILVSMRRLVRLGFLQRDGSLTETGRMIVRLMHPNATAIVMVLQSLRQLSAEDAALIAAFFCNERPPRRIKKALRHPLIEFMARAAARAELQEIDPRDGARRAWIIRQWMRGREMDLRQMVGVEAEGDIERLRIQVVELLRKMENLDLAAATEALYYLDPHFHQEHPDWQPAAPEA